MRGRLAALFCGLLVVPAFAVAQDNSDLIMGVGSKLFWGHADFPYSETIVAMRDDFTIYLNDEFEDTRPGPKDYYVIFSGIYFEVCDTKLPTQKQRDAFKDFLPLVEGAELVTDLGTGVTLTVAEPSTRFLMGKDRNTNRIVVAYNNEDIPGETIDVIDGLPLTARVTYDDGDAYRLTLLTRSDEIGVSEKLEQENLGNCAELLKE